MRRFLIIVRTIHGLVETTKLASLEIPDEDGNHDSKEAVEDIQHTKHQCEFGLARVGWVCAGVVWAVAAAGRHGSEWFMDFGVFLVVEDE